MCFSACKKADVDLVFVVDSSETSNDNWNMLKQFLSEIVRNMPIGSDGVNFGAVVYSDRAQVVSELFEMNDEQSALRAISSLPHMRGKITSVLNWRVQFNELHVSVPTTLIFTRKFQEN